jgi:hypothetical protein
VKLENFSYTIVMKAFELLEREHHYKVPEDIKKEIAGEVVKQIDALIES